MAKAAKPNAMINALIASVSPDSISDFVRQQNRSFRPVHEDLSYLLSENLSFCELTKLGEIEYADTDRLLIFSCLYDGELSARSARKMQFEIAKKALKEDFKDGAIFVFYDARGTFRFSFIRRNYGQKEQKYSNWKRFTYFVEPNAQTNRTFRERVGGCKFESLDAIQNAFSVEQLTKDFYKELSNWYFWAIKNVSFPNDVNDDSDNHKFNSENVIRLITRLIFSWFLKQKDLIKPELFDTKALATILKDFDATSNTQNNYYRAILQNLFFATLNQEIDKRGFAEDKNFNQNKSTYNIKNLYRYEKEFVNGTSQIMELFRKVPFLNGGLFECLDNKQKEGKTYDWDGFSRNPHLQANIPNALFFANELKVDLSSEYNDKKKKTEKVTGIIEILKRYNFTVEENTPVEVEVALDPELLGKVFENLLGAFNPETQETARKQTGSFYTPREIVNYMVDESLIAYLNTCLSLTQADSNDDKLRELLGYETDLNPFDAVETKSLIHFIFNCKILDPATGSGAFPMGILQQMVHILRKLDPENTHWNNVVMEQALKDFEAAEELSDIEKQNLLDEIEHSFDDSVNYPDYARKLYLIENCIYGVDIQSIAVQISKLRFFISLVCEQNHSDDATDNFGIRPLPNLETKFVAANTLIGIEKNEEDMRLFRQDKILKLIKKLKEVRHRQFLVTNAQKKKDLREQDETLRHDIVTEVQTLYVKRADDDIFRLKMQLKQSEKELENLNKKTDVIQTSAEQLDIFGGAKTKTINLTENKRSELKTLINILNREITESSHYARLESVVQLAEQLTSWNPYDQNASSPFFDPEWMFGVNELKIGYFDIVIGNPPWGAKLELEQKELFKSYYPDIDSSTPNTFSYFVGWAVKNYNCIISYVLPDSILIKDYSKTRTLIKEYVSEIVWYENSGVPEEFKPFVFVDHDVCILNILNKKSEFFKKKLCRYDKKQRRINEEVSLQEKSKLFLKEFDFAFNLIAEDKHVEILNKIIKFKPLYEFMQCHEGIHTGNSRELLFIKNYNNIYCKPLFYGGGAGDCIQNYTSKTSGWHVDYRSELIEKSKGFYASLRDERIFNLPKIYISRTGNPFKVFYDENTYASNNFFSLQHIDYSKNNSNFLKYILPFVISKLSQFFIRTFAAPRLGSTFIETKIFHLLKFCVPFCNEKVKNDLISKVDFILLNKYSNSFLETSDVEFEIEAIIYRLYNLTYEEVRVIDPKIESKLSEEDYNLIEIE